MLVPAHGHVRADTNCVSKFVGSDETWTVHFNTTNDNHVLIFNGSKKY